MTKRKDKKKVISSLLLGLLVSTAGLLPALTSINYGYADMTTEVIKDYDSTTIESDLSDIDVTNYPASANGTPQVIRFQEYCYSEKPFFTEAYGLYLYVYNPTQAVISTKMCVANMATAYGEDNNPTNYENVKLTYLDEAYGYRFLKFKITDDSEFLTTAQAQMELHGERRYDIAGVQLYYTDGTSKDVNCSYTYKWTGYAKGLGTDGVEESTLFCEPLVTLSLDVKHTYYRPTMSTVDSPTVDTLHSVYFTIPNAVLDKYGSLYEIEAEYLSATLKPVLVTGNQTAYDAFQSTLWEDMSEHCPSVPYAYIANFYIGLADNIGAGEFTYNFEYGHSMVVDNIDGSSLGLEGGNFLESTKYLQALYLMFGTNDWGTDSADSYVLNGEVLQAAMKDTATNERATDIIAGAQGAYATDIFSKYDTEKQNIKVTADDTFDLTADVVQKDFWDKLFGGAGDTVMETITSNRKAIKIIDDSDFANSIAAICDNLLISEADYATFYEDYQTAKANDETMVLFHYRKSDYTAHEATLFSLVNSLGVKTWYEIDSNAYFFTQDVDLDFDIIDVTFRNADGDTVLGVVADPIDIVNSVTPPSNTTKDSSNDGLLTWVKWLIGIVVLLICIPFIPQIASVIVWVVKLPFKLISKISEAIKQRKKKKEKKKKVNKQANK